MDLKRRTALLTGFRGVEGQLVWESDLVITQSQWNRKGRNESLFANITDQPAAYLAWWLLRLGEKPQLLWISVIPELLVVGTHGSSPPIPTEYHAGCCPASQQVLPHMCQEQDSSLFPHLTLSQFCALWVQHLSLSDKISSMSPLVHFCELNLGPSDSLLGSS